MARTFASAHLPENIVLVTPLVAVVTVASVVVVDALLVAIVVVSRTNLYDVAPAANTVDSHAVA